MGTSGPKTQLDDNAAYHQPLRQQSAAQREAVAARRGSRVRAGGVVMGRGRAFALAAMLAVMAFGCLAARADAFVYWGQGVSVARANLDGSDVKPNFVAPSGAAQGVAVDGQHVYWTDYFTNTIGRANLDGTGIDQAFISPATAGSTPQGVAVDGQHIYWTDARGTIARANLDGSDVDQSFITGAYAGAGVAVDGQYIYWADSAYGTIERANLDGTDVDPIFITGAGVPLAVAVNGQHVYWTNINGTIGRANIDGSAVNQVFITGADTPDAIAVDGQHIYWVNESDGTIGRAGLDSSDVDQSFIFTGADNPVGLAVDPLPLTPSASITTPALGATYTVGQAVDSSFTCSEGAGGPGIASCLDQSGRASGDSIDTSTIGPHTFTVTATSSDGQTGSASSTYTVVPPSPVVRDLRVSHSRWREGIALPRITSDANRTPMTSGVGTTFSFTLNEPATVKLTFTRQASGRVVQVDGHGECVARTSHNRRARKCTRTVVAGTLAVTAPRGTDKIGFAGRVSSTNKLRLGSYTATVTATNASGETSNPEALRFTIVK
jgi:virginiamycin B lyase